MKRSLDHLAALLIAVVAVLGMFAVAVACRGVDPAEKLTYDAIAPEYWGYVLADERLSDDDRERRLRTVEAWASAVGGEVPQREGTAR